MSRIVGFPPITHTEDQVLILGSMPSVESLKQDMYYANKTNRFWPMLGKIFELPYQTRDDKLNLVKSANIAIWDVCYSCQRETSADAKIRDIIPNDIAKLLFVMEKQVMTLYENISQKFKPFLYQVHQRQMRNIV